MTSLYEDLRRDRSSWANEEELRKSWLKYLENDLDIRFHAERDRNDASYNQVIIEFKGRGLFRGSTNSLAFKEAIFDRLAKYIPRRARHEGLKPEDYIGIATDGDHICFAFYRNGAIRHRNLLPFNADSIALVARACQDSKRRAVTAENLVEDFGHGSSIGKATMAALSRALEVRRWERGNNKVKMLFSEWRALFGQVADLSAAQAKEIQWEIPFRYSAEDRVAALLFVIHTYNAFVMKLLAAEIVAEYGLTAHADFCEHLLGYENQQLLERLDIEIERGAYFEGARIKGFVEEAIFSWYADSSLAGETREELCAAIRQFATQLSLYRMDDLSAARSKDVLKSFYQSLVPETLRKALGEFYTPDWLVDVACDRAGDIDWWSTRALDPTCGSGSFLLEIIRRKRAAAERKHLSDVSVLKSILTSVWGFDLNPLAVQASRVNFLIAIADLVSASKSEIELPVLLADAVYSPASAPQGEEEIVEYRIGSTQSDLKIVLPAGLAFDRAKLDAVFAVMELFVEDDRPYKRVEAALVSRNVVSEKDAKAWREPLKETYEQVLELHRKAWNGIWFRIVRNFFWSAVAGRFDLVIGNPPWVRWSNLPETYRNRIKSTCERYAIFSETPYHGGNELDISGMITYTVGDKWLRDGGSLVFIITQTHFQSPSSQGFRSFKIDDESNLIPRGVDDLKKLKPFPKVANKTAIMRLRKVSGTREPEYPVPYRIWEKAGSFGASIPEDATKAEVLKRVQIKNWEATPVDGGNSPWAILPKGRFAEMTELQGECEWVAGRKGVTTDLNGVFMVRVVATNAQDNLVQIETRPDAGKNDIGPARRFWIEPDLLYPLLKGASDFSACHVHVDEELYILVPNKGIRQSDYANAEATVSTLSNTAKYFRAYRKLLQRRSTYKLRQRGAPYYSVYNSGAYTFAPYKVTWAELSSSFEAAVFKKGNVPLAGRRVYVPDHKVYFADFNDADAAYYLCGLLNSSIVREYVQSHTIQIQVSNIFKHLRLPEFDPSNATHAKISELCQKAHEAPSDTKRSEIIETMNKLTEKFLAR